MPDVTNSTDWVLGQGRYQVKRKLGEGGMAFALLALDKTLGADVVLKVPKPNMMADPDFARRFRREIRSMQELTHEHIVKIKDVGEHEGMPFYVMDLLAGGSLQDRFELTADGKQKPMPPDSLADWLEPVARALDFIHQRFVHRDIKPANILFDAYGNAFVSDFGIVKAIADGSNESKQTVMTQAGMVIGTGPYMAPEVSEGKKIDGRVDQYALAVTVYQALSGRVPFDGTSFVEIIKQQVLGKIPPLHELVPTLPKSLTKVIEKGLSLEPNGRYASCAAFAEAVLALVKAIPVVSKTNARPKAVCPACKKRFSLPPDPAGKSVACPACGTGFTVARKSGKQRSVQGKATSLAAAVRTPPATISVARHVETLTTSVPTRTERQATGRNRRLLYVSIAAILPVCAIGLLALVWNPRSQQTKKAVEIAMQKSDKNEAPTPLKPVASEPPVKKENVPPAPKEDVPKKIADKDPPAAPKGNSPKSITNSIGMKFVWIPSGTFMMGSPKDEKGLWLSEFQHKVTLTKGYYMGMYAVTQEEWQAVMGNNPSRFKGEKNLPVEGLSWYDCETFINKLREKDKNPYRLPTEAEWEYACRAGTTTPFYFGETISTDQANYNGNYNYGNGQKGLWRGRTTPVGSFPSNAWGLHDMHGNVYEWCQDWRGDYPKTNVVDPEGPDKGEYRVLRGGSWAHAPHDCRSAHRSGSLPFIRYNGYGFRVCFFMD